MNISRTIYALVMVVLILIHQQSGSGGGGVVTGFINSPDGQVVVLILESATVQTW